MPPKLTKTTPRPGHRGRHPALGKRQTTSWSDAENPPSWISTSDEKVFMLEEGYVRCFVPTSEGEPCTFTLTVPRHLINSSTCFASALHDPVYLKDTGASREFPNGRRFQCARRSCSSGRPIWNSEQDWTEAARGKPEKFESEDSRRYFNLLRGTTRSGGEEGEHGASAGKSDHTDGRVESSGYAIIGSEEIRKSKNGEPAGGPPSGMGALLGP